MLTTSKCSTPDGAAGSTKGAKSHFPLKRPELLPSTHQIELLSLQDLTPFKVMIWPLWRRPENGLQPPHHSSRAGINQLSLDTALRPSSAEERPVRQVLEWSRAGGLWGEEEGTQTHSDEWEIKPRTPVLVKRAARHVWRNSSSVRHIARKWNLMV